MKRAMIVGDASPKVKGNEGGQILLPKGRDGRI